MSDRYKNLKLDDIVFEGRNQSYGGYLLRKTYAEHVNKALIFAATAFVLAIASPIIYDLLKPEEEIEEQIVTVDPKMIQPPPIDPNIPPPPPMPSSPPPPKVSTVRFIPPEVAKDEEVIEEEPPKQEQLKEAVAGKETVQGDPDADPGAISLEDVGTGTGTQIVAPVEEEIFNVVEQQPEAGYDFMKFFRDNIKYPPQAQRAEVEGVVYVGFVVGSDGHIQDVKIARGIGFGCDEEAMRVVSKLPPWVPGKQGGRPVKVRMNLPVRFKLAK